MRYDKPIFFQRTKPGEYNAITGNYGDSKAKPPAHLRRGQNN